MDGGVRGWDGVSRVKGRGRRSKVVRVEAREASVGECLKAILEDPPEKAKNM